MHCLENTGRWRFNLQKPLTRIAGPAENEGPGGVLSPGTWWHRAARAGVLVSGMRTAHAPKPPQSGPPPLLRQLNLHVDGEQWQ